MFACGCVCVLVGVFEQGMNEACARHGMGTEWAQNEHGMITSWTQHEEGYMQGMAGERHGYGMLGANRR